MSVGLDDVSNDFEKLSRLESASTLVATEGSLSPMTQCDRRSSSVTIMTEDEVPVGEYQLLCRRIKCGIKPILIEEASGIRGFARIKDYDPRFNFHPALAIERSMVLDFQAQQIVCLGRKIQTIRRKIERNHLVDPRVPPPKYRTHRRRVAKQGNKYNNKNSTSVISSSTKDAKRLQEMMEMLGKSLAQYGELHHTYSWSSCVPLNPEC